MLYRELTTVIPFYLSEINQDRYKENVLKTCDVQRIVSPKNFHLPFMLEVHCKKKPTKWILRDLNGNEFVDLKHSLHKLKGVKYKDGRVYCYFFGGELLTTFDSFKKSSLLDDFDGNQEAEKNLRPVVLSGFYYHEITFEDVTYSSEVIHYLNAPKYEFDDKFMKLEFRSEPNISEIRYPDGFYQVLYLDTFSHSSRIEYEEEGEEDGVANFIPTFQKMNIFYQNTVLTRDFLKNAIHTLKLHDEIKVTYKDERFGEIINIEVNSEESENGAIHTVNFDFLCNILTKSGCKADEVEIEDFFNYFFIEDVYITTDGDRASYLSLPLNYDGSVEETEITASPTEFQIRFIEGLNMEINPRPYFYDEDSFKMKVKNDAGIWSNEFSVFVTFEMRIRNSSLTIPRKGTDSIKINEFYNDTVADVEILREPEHLILTRISGLFYEIRPINEYFGEDSFEFRVKNQNDVWSLPITVDVTVLNT